ncbi:D-methionine transport system permease protein MetI [compost metagenome]|uniref:Methionine ABC transporter permease n=1 Tax=Paenibacillus stellifer TaxID=169760 RepID=A0A089LZ27_9BACL|nr:methionine ABC transporter permease [Paenibacillus stellifer]AIQ64508.1 methionine ABC transporter permease [Paenibacillus stellifer]
MDNTWDILRLELFPAMWDTLIMIFISMAASLIFGLLIGLVLYLSSSRLFFPNRVLNAIMGVVVNIIRSIPFVILLVLLIPVTKVIAGTSIGPVAASVPLAFASIAFFARLVEGAFSEVDKGVLEAAIATGAGLGLILRKVLFVEAMPGLIRATTVTVISLIGYSAMAGLVGGGGIGDLAIQYGYYRYETGVMFATVILLILIVQGAQFVGDWTARIFTRK